MNAPCCSVRQLVDRQEIFTEFHKNCIGLESPTTPLNHYSINPKIINRLTEWKQSIVTALVVVIYIK